VLTRAARGTPVDELVAGEAGVGKSRLVRETASLAAARGFRVLSGACADAGEGGVPYGPIVEALRTLVRGLEPTAIDSLVGDARGDHVRLAAGRGVPLPSWCRCSPLRPSPRSPPSSSRHACWTGSSACSSGWPRCGRSC